LRKQFIDKWIADVWWVRQPYDWVTRQRFAESGIVPFIRLVLIGAAVAPTRGRVD